MISKASSEKSSLPLTLLVAAGLVGYVSLFLSTLLTSEAPQLGSRALVFLRLLIPDFFWESWTADGKLPMGGLDRIPLVVAGAAWLGLAWLWGRGALQLGANQLGVNPLAAAGGISRRTKHPLAIAVGLSLLSLVTCWVGLAGLLGSRWPLVILLVVGTGLSLWSVVRSLRMNRDKVAADANGTQGARNEIVGNEVVSSEVENGEITLLRRLTQVAQVVCGALLLVYIAAGCMPPIEFDVLEYHLQAPKEFWQLGRITFLPHNIYANMPLGAEMHSLAWMTLIGGEDGWWWGGAVGKLIIALAAPVTAWLIGAMVADYFGRAAGWIAASLYLGMPGIAEISAHGLIDAYLGLYVAAIAALLWGWSSQRITPHANGRKNEFAAFSLWLGWMAGAAVACKYPAALFVVVPVGLIWIFSLWQASMSWQSLLKAGALFALMVGLSSGTWLAKNVVLTGNPLFPLMYPLFGGEGMDEAKYAQWQKAHAVPSAESSADEAPQKYSFPQLQESLKQIAIRSPMHHPIVVPFAVFAIALMSVAGASKDREMARSSLYRCKSSMIKLAAWLLFTIAAWWFVTHRIDRFLLPFLTCGAILAGCSINEVAKLGRGVILAAALSIGWLYSLLLLGALPISDSRYLVSLESLRRDVSGQEIGRVSPSIGWLNANLTKEDRVLMVGDAAVYDVTAALRYSTCFDSSLWDEATSQVELEKVRGVLSKQGITHVCINWIEIARYRSFGNYGFRSQIEPVQVQQWVTAGLLEPINCGIDPAGVAIYRVRQ